MKRGYGLFVLLTLVLLTSPAAAYVLDHHECYRANDEATRVETARAILMVNAVPSSPYYYEDVIYYWADQPVAPPDGEGAIYKETVLTNYSRQEMADYLEIIFGWSSDMELVIQDQMYETHPDGTMTYMATNKWFGTWAGVGDYVQPGMSIVKFEDPDSGCATYQRDYFTEADTWWGVPELNPMVTMFREEYIRMFGLTGRCFDDDGDGYTKYAAAYGCPNVGLDCNDYVAEINPGAEEIMGNGLDDDCDGGIDGPPPPCATLPGKAEGAATLFGYYALLLVPAVYGYFLKRRFSGNRRN